MSANHYMRVWQKVDVESIKQHLLIVGDLTGDCGACRHFGIRYQEARECPECKTPFHFVALRSGGNLRNAGHMVRRLKENRSDLTFVDYDDFKTLTGKQNARDLLG